MSRRRRAWVLLVVPCLAIVLGASPASAHVVYENGWEYKDRDLGCVWADSEVSHGNHNKGYTQVIAESYGSNCSSHAAKPAGYIAVKSRYYHNSGSNLCWDSGWKYNDIKASGWDFDHHFTSTPCGSGNYGTNGGAYVWIDGAWRGGYRWSGWHSLPASSGSGGGGGGGGC